MRILILGAGGTGGYFGGRLVEAGADVTFLLRPERQNRIRENGLVIKSPVGNAQLQVQTILAGEAARKFDIVLVTCKAYDLDSALEAIEPHVDAGALALPIMNGMAHNDFLRERLGHGRVVGGICQCSTTINAFGEIEHLNPMARMVFGAFADQPNRLEVDPVLDDLLAVTTKASFASKRADPIDQNLWDKWVMLATLAGMTTLMRASVGEIMATKGGPDLMAELLEETAAVATEAEYPPSEDYLKNVRSLLFDRNSGFTASMLRDMEAGGPIEGEHIIGDMYHRARDAGLDAHLLRIAYCHLQAYEARRAKAAK
ncbi:2-dehydropantoate 2-reductase [Dongia sp. agr-C8]